MHVPCPPIQAMVVSWSHLAVVRAACGLTVWAQDTVVRFVWAQDTVGALKSGCMAVASCAGDKALPGQPDLELRGLQGSWWGARGLPRVPFSLLASSLRL